MDTNIYGKILIGLCVAKVILIPLFIGGEKKSKNWTAGDFFGAVIALVLVLLALEII